MKVSKRKNQKVISINEDIKYNDEELKPQIKDESPGPEKIYERKEFKSLVKECIESLPPDYKTVIVLSIFEGFSYEEIAKIINCPEGTVKSQISRQEKL